MATVLSESIESSKLSFINESSEHAGRKYLGKLKGVCAECGVPTRNRRVYSRALWEKVIGSSTFKEQMSNKCLFGELNHPADRLETDIKEVAIALSDISFGQGNDLIGTFDILDTPNGRLLKNLCDYGAVLGVSSRGGGDVDTDGTNDIVNEDTYDFVAFDVVALPAVIKARPTVIESVEYKKKAASLTESIMSEVNSVQTAGELASLKRILENVNVPGVDSIMESINNKLETLSGGSNSEALLEDLSGALARVKDLEKKNAQLTEAASAGATREAMLESENKKLRSASRILGEKLKVAKTVTDSEELKTLKNSLKEAESRNVALTHRVSKLKTIVRESVEGENNAVTAKLAEADARVKAEQRRVNSLQASLEAIKESSASEISKLKTIIENQKKDASLVESMSTKKLSSSQALVESLRKENKAVLETYLNNICRMKGINVQVVRRKLSENYTLDEVNTIIEQVSDYKVRIGALPFEVSDGLAVVAKRTVESAPVRSVSSNPDDDNLEGAASLLAITNPNSIRK